MAFAPGGVPFGEQTFDAQHLLAGFIGKEKADAFCEQVRLKGIQEEETEE
jgi:hypothetical protein